MSRYKTFDSTGLATAGRLYAGDLNAIQDQLADLYNLTQSLGVSSVALGEAGLQLLHYGAGEARLSGHMRVDGILRGLGGLYAGQYTTTQRDAIPLGSRPFTLLVFNTTTGQFEYNAGTDATPSWLPITPTNGVIPIGAAMEWDYGSGQIPSWTLLQYGQAVSRSTYSILNGIASTAGYPHGSGDGSTTFNIADKRGRVSAGKDDMGGSAANRITAAISGTSGATLGAVMGNEGVTLTTAQIPAHSHPVTGAPAIGSLAVTGAPSVGSLSGTIDDPALEYDGSTIPSPGGWAINSGDRQGSHVTISGAPGIGSLAVGGAPAVGSLGTSNTGSGGTHLNTQPTIIVNKMIRAL